MKPSIPPVSLKTLDPKAAICERLHPEIDVLELLGFFFPEKQEEGHIQFYMEFPGPTYVGKPGKLWGRIAQSGEDTNEVTLATRFNLPVPEALPHITTHQWKMGDGLLGSGFMGIMVKAIYEASRAFTKDRMETRLIADLVSV